MSKSRNNKELPDQALDRQDEQASDPVQSAQADNVREKSAAAYLYATMTRTVGDSMPPDTYKAYRDQLLADSGNPRDPIEIMLVEMTALAFHNIGRLHVKSATTDDHQVATTYAAAATKLTAEFRRLSLALAEYRASASSRLGVVDGDSEEAPTTTRHVA